MKEGSLVQWTGKLLLDNSWGLAPPLHKELVYEVEYFFDGSGGGIFAKLDLIKGHGYNVEMLREVAPPEDVEFEELLQEVVHP